MELRKIEEVKLEPRNKVSIYECEECGKITCFNLKINGEIQISKCECAAPFKPRNLYTGALQTHTSKSDIDYIGLETNDKKLFVVKEDEWKRAPRKQFEKQIIKKEIEEYER